MKRDKREWLIDLRKEKELTQSQIANQVGLSKNHYCNIENGIRTPSGKIALKISEELEFPMEKFYQEAN
jgi:putative transcriptional regulator